jgi:hypothetical protein
MGVEKYGSERGGTEMMREVLELTYSVSVNDILNCIRI